MFGFKGLAALRNDVALGLGVVWNLLCLPAIWLNGATGQVRGSGALALLCLASGGMAAFMLAVVTSERINEMVIHRQRRDVYDPRSFVLVAGVSGLLAVLLLFTLLGLLGES